MFWIFGSLAFGSYRLIWELVAGAGFEPATSGL